MAIEERFNVGFVAKLTAEEKQIQQNYRPVIGVHKWFARRAGAPFVFTYHHRELSAYAPVVVAILDAGLACTAALPCPAEMTASLHIYGTGASVMDTIFVCRAMKEGTDAPPAEREALRDWLIRDQTALAGGGIPCTRGDLYCLALGHLARAAVQSLRSDWDQSCNAKEKLGRVERTLERLSKRCAVHDVIREVLQQAPAPARALRPRSEELQGSLFDQVGDGGN